MMHKCRASVLDVKHLSHETQKFESDRDKSTFCYQFKTFCDHFVLFSSNIN